MRQVKSLWCSAIAISHCRSQSLGRRRQAERSSVRQPYLSSSLFWIEVLTQTVAKEIESEDGEGDRDSGKEEYVRSVVKNVETARFFDHCAPARSGRRDAKSEE